MKVNTEEFVENPSNITKHIVDIVLKLNEEQEAQFKTKNPFGRLYK